MEPTTDQENPSVLITGGTGVLGEQLRAILQQQAIPCLLSSRTNPTGLSNWVYMDLATGQGMEAATKNKQIIFHLASGTKKPDRNMDVGGTKRLLKSARAKLKIEADFLYPLIVNHKGHKAFHKAHKGAL